MVVKPCPYPPPSFVIPAEAGIHGPRHAFWIPTFVGMTGWGLGMTGWGLGMTGWGLGMTDWGVGNDELGSQGGQRGKGNDGSRTGGLIPSLSKLN